MQLLQETFFGRVLGGVGPWVRLDKLAAAAMMVSTLSVGFISQSDGARLVKDIYICSLGSVSKDAQSRHVILCDEALHLIFELPFGAFCRHSPASA